VGGIIMSVIIGLLNNQFEIDYRICWIIGASFAVLNNFFGQKLIVFKN
jgi:putative flippase GtrA